MKKILVLIILPLMIFPSTLRAEEEISLTLEEAIIFALRDNRDILLKAEDINKAKAKIAEAKALLFPSLTFTASETQTKGYYSKDISQATAQATLKQGLFKGWKVINTIKYNEYGLEISQSILDKTKLELIYNVRKAFYTFLLANEFVNLNKGILENTQKHLEATKIRYSYGQVSESDLLKIQDSLTTVIQAYEASLNQAESAQAVLRNLLYLTEAVTIKAQGEFIYEPKEVAYDEAFLKAMGTRPEIKQYELQGKAQERAVDIAKAGNRPTIYASWDYYSRSHISATTTKSWNDYNVIGLTFSWPIFDGWETRAKVEQAIVDLKEAQLLKEKTITDIALELKNAYLDLNNAIHKAKITQSEVDLYEDTLLITQEKYKVGIASSLDLDDATLGYQVSLFNQNQAIYDYVVYKALFEKATGGIL